MIGSRSATGVEDVGGDLRQALFPSVGGGILAIHRALEIVAGEAGERGMLIGGETVQVARRACTVEPFSIDPAEKLVNDGIVGVATVGEELVRQGVVELDMRWVEILRKYDIELASSMSRRAAFVTYDGEVTTQRGEERDDVGDGEGGFVP